MASDFFIHGLDEAGRIGEKIIFCEASINCNDEVPLMLRNIWHFHKLILNKNDVRGYDETTLLKFVSELIDERTIIIHLYNLSNDFQNLLLRGLFYHLSNNLFRIRGQIIESYTKRDRIILEDVLKNLNAFKRKAIYSESFVKSYIMKEITGKIGSSYLRQYSTIENLQGDNGPRIDIQIDGGYPFAFWWSDLLDNLSSGLIRGKCFVTGLTNGDTYYPVVSLAGTIASILHKYPAKQYYFPINEINKLEVDTSSEVFFQHYIRHAYSLSKPIFQKRMLLIGSYQDDLKPLIPYIYYKKQNRSNTYEPFFIQESLENFIKEFGYGSPENTIIIVGKLDNTTQKQDLKKCREFGYSIIEINELKEDIDQFFTELVSEAELSPATRRTEMLSRLTRIKSSCIQDLQ